jgi:hypothetical protein
MNRMATKPAVKSRGSAIYTTIPTWLYDKVAAEAKREHRSIAAQIAMALEARYGKKENGE